MNYQLYHSNNAGEDYLHNTIAIFLKEIYDIMKNCYGPFGSHILISGQTRAEATKDGKTILSRIKTNQSLPTAIHSSIQSVADKQVYEVGDGSTTTILLLCELYNSFRKIIKDNGISPSMFNNELRECVKILKEELKNNATQVCTQNEDGSYEINYDELYNAIYTSVDGEKELADMIIIMLKELNDPEPLVLIEMSQTEKHHYETVKGIEIDGSIIRPDVFFNGYSRREYMDPSIVVVNGRLDLSLERFMNLAQASVRYGKDYIFICTGIDEMTLDGIVNINNTNPGMFGRIAIFQTTKTAHDDEFLDICASLGANPIDSESLKKAMTDDIVMKQISVNAGSCSKALLTEFMARFNEPKSDDSAIKLRLDRIQEQIDDLTNDHTVHNTTIYDLENRKAFLSKKYAKFYVGGYSPQRKAINYELANDGIPQAISCMKHGIVDGCNIIIPYIVDLLKVHKETDPVKSAIYDSIKDGYLNLFKQLIINKVGDVNTAENIVNEHFSRLGGYTESLNIRDNDTIRVVNSADTDRAILENATDMAALLATSKGFLSTNTEFDVVNKGYHLDD